MANIKAINTFRDNPERIGRNVSPFTTLRKIAQRIAQEEINVVEWPSVPTHREDKVTIVEAILYTWAYSHDFPLERIFLEVAYGKPPIETRISGPEGEPLIPLSTGFDLSKLSVNELTALRNILLKSKGASSEDDEKRELEMNEESTERAEEVGADERFFVHF